MKPLFVFLLLILASHCSVSQQKKIDSLLAVYVAYEKEDSLKVSYLINIFRAYSVQKNFERVEAYGNEALRIADKLPYSYSLTRVYFRLGLCYHVNAIYLKAIDYYKKGIAVALKRNDKSNAAGFYINLSALYYSIPDYAKALEANEMAVSLYHKLGDAEQISSSYMNIGLIYLDMENPGKAIAYMEKALAIFKRQDNGVNYGAAIAYNGIGNAYQVAKENDLRELGIPQAVAFERSLHNHNMSLQLAGQLKERAELEREANKDIGQLYENNGNRTLALQYYQKALGNSGKVDSKESLVSTLFSLGRFHLRNKNYRESKNYLEQGLGIAREIGSLSIQRNTAEQMSKLYEELKQFDSALIYYQEYVALRDTIFSQEKEKEITRRQLQLDFAVKENDYKLMQQLSDGKLKQQLLLATQQQQQLLLKQQQLQLVSKEKDLQQLAYLKKQAESQNEKQLQAALMQKNKLQAAFDRDVRDKQISAQQTQISFDKKVKSFLALAILLATVITGLIFYNHRKTKKLNAIISEQKISLEQLGNVKDKIFSVVSHDLRTPVNSLVSFINLLEAGPLPPEKLALYSNELKQNLRYTSSLMNNLLTWAASQMQGFKPVRETIDITETFTEVLQTLQQQQHQKQVQVRNEIPAGTMIYADRNMTATVFRNLLSNAIKFSYQGAGINISSYNKKNGLAVVISDNGTGMQADHIREFNHNGHQQAESKRGTANEKGTGLGLLLCKTFMSQMGGTMLAEAGNPGTIFTTWFPAVEHSG
jgi:signal transduction histidine kinase